MASQDQVPTPKTGQNWEREIHLEGKQARTDTGRVHNFLVIKSLLFQLQTITISSPFPPALTLSFLELSSCLLGMKMGRNVIRI